ncbi:hypothetical protein [Mesorhizobium sp.]|uniref:hypothetical protein n=1 Tax=Mesorhizobium sp. TaxID=1871066 RepID=UPI000FE535F7|nr:hypothetical protein [Mesorhizobium sp.]RWP05083.1 MAG: hypothetical protein EOQ99_16565 [Mesorhizobium sp.]
MDNMAKLPLNDTPQPIRESKEDAFDRLAPARMSRALDAIRLVGNLSNRSAYAYSADDVADMVGVLRLAITDIESRFRVNSPRVEFQLRR